MRRRFILSIMIMLQMSYYSNSQILTPAQTEKFVKNYIKIHAQYPDSYSRAYYVNSRAFIFLDSFFSQPNPFDGLTIYFVAYQKEVAKEQKDKFQSLIFAAPTKSPDGMRHNAHLTRKTDFDTLFKFLQKLNNKPSNFFQRDFLNKGIVCPGMCDEVIKTWDNDPLRADKSLTDTPGGGSFGDEFLFSVNNKHMIYRFIHATNHEQELGGKETNSIYFEKEKIKNIANFVKEGKEENYPMVGFYYASYGEQVDDTYQANINQTTLVMVPLKTNSTGGYTPDFVGYHGYLLYLKKKGKDGGENHGTLCPNACPPEGN